MGRIFYLLHIYRKKFRRIVARKSARFGASAPGGGGENDPSGGGMGGGAIRKDSGIIVDGGITGGGIYESPVTGGKIICDSMGYCEGYVVPPPSCGIY